MLLSQIVKSCMDIVFPPGCLLCEERMVAEGGGSLCATCSGQIRYLRLPFCRICGIEVYSAESENPLCSECLRNPPPYTLARSVVRYEAPIQQLIHKLKYGRDLSVIPGLAEIIGRYDMTEFADIDRVVVVPLHLQRLRRRGLNQAAVLARLFFAEKRPLIQADWLIRVRNTVPQTELGRAARRRNLVGAFAARPKSDVSGKRICLVDDVFTTGTTVRECSKAIMRNGAKEVKVLTLARVQIPQRGRHL